MKVTSTNVNGVLIVEPVVHVDDRGFFLESWHRKSFATAGIVEDFVQDNHSRSVKGTLRGLHYQIERAQGKLVRVVRGEILDVAVDLRRSSSTFGRWTGSHLSAENHRIMWIPPGFAHGFYTLSDEADVLYRCTDYYSPQHECTLLWCDEELDIDWRIQPGSTPRLSDKDKAGVRFAEAPYYP